MNLAVLMKNDALKAFFPLHDDEPRAKLFESWVKRFASPSSQPLDEVKVRPADVLYHLFANRRICIQNYFADGLDLPAYFSYRPVLVHPCLFFLAHGPAYRPAY